MMNAFDVGATTFFNRFAQHSKLLDLTVHFLANNPLLKGGVLAVIIWWVWFQPDKPETKRRDYLLATLIGGCWPSY